MTYSGTLCVLAVLERFTRFPLADVTLKPRSLALRLYKCQICGKLTLLDIIEYEQVVLFNILLEVEFNRFNNITPIRISDYNLINKISRLVSLHKLVRLYLPLFIIPDDLMTQNGN